MVVILNNGSDINKVMYMFKRTYKKTWSYD